MAVKLRARIAITGLGIALVAVGARLDAQAPIDTVRLALVDVRARALRFNPELAAVRLDTAIARGTLRQARLLPFNPTATVLLPGTGAGSRVNASLSQEIEVFGQRGLRVAGAMAGVDRAAAGIADARRLTLGDVDRAFYRFIAATSRLTLAEEVLSLNARLADVAARELKAGQISRLDENLAVVELGRSRARALAARREREQTDIELKRLTGIPMAAIFVPVLDLSQHLPNDTSHLVHAAGASRADSAQRLSLDDLIAVALNRRPDLQASEAQIRQADAAARLAARTALPNVVASALTEDGAGGGRTVRPGIGIALPLFNRNQGETQGRRAALEQVELERSALLIRVRAEVASALAAYRTASAEAEGLEATVLQPARENRRLLEIAYREGKFGLPVLILVRNQAIDAELEYVAAWLAEREARAMLDQTIGAVSTSAEPLPTTRARERP
jgi:cobalt-zinc-cadmium efflux system outer membrane protein